MSKIKTVSEPLATFQDTTIRAVTEKLEKISKRKKAKAGQEEEDDDVLKDERTFTITAGKIVDDFCHYSFEIISGVGIGEVHGVKGKVGIIKESMRKAFVVFHVHLAALDGAFRLSAIDVDDIDKFHKHELTGNYFVTGFEIKGADDNESIVLSGSKYVPDAGGRMELFTPRIPLDNLSSYKWWNELKAAADKARHEVARYKEGHCTIPEEDDEEENPKQLKMQIDQPLEPQENKMTDEEFENAAR